MSVSLKVKLNDSWSMLEVDMASFQAALARAKNGGFELFQGLTWLEIEANLKSQTNSSEAHLNSLKNWARETSAELTHPVYSWITRLSSDDSDDTKEKPFICLEPDCGKAYKNRGGLKYHMKHGHQAILLELSEMKPYQCAVSNCLKRYKNANGLKVS
jgi:hypothetical protein